MKTALIFNIQKFCVHDGPGIRTTVFFKGCPLNCLWCHNPESQNFSREILWAQEKCTGCGHCEQVCPERAVHMADRVPTQDLSRCTLCQKCMNICVNNAREIAGTEYTMSQLMAEIEKDRPFYDQSKGGVTLSGGEVLSQIDFVAELTKTCKDRGISVAIDTCGYAPFASFEKIMGNVDVFLYDIKLMSSVLHQQYTGKDNLLILENLKKLARNNAAIILRLPLIQGINDDDCNIEAIIEFTKDLGIASVNLLPYHDIGKGKYEKLNRQYRGQLMFSPSQERLKEIKARFEQANFKVEIWRVIV